MFHASRTVRTSAVLALAALALTGCSLAPAGISSTGAPSSEPTTSTQSVKEACLAIKPTLLSLTSEMTDALGDLKTDPASAVPLLQKVSGEFRDAIADLDNADVVDVTTTAADSLDAMTAEVQKAVGGNVDQTALLAAATKVQTDFNAIDTLCRPAVDGN